MEPDKEIPRLSYSVAKTIVTKSALHAYDEHRLLGGNKKEPSAAMKEGSLLEKFVLDADMDKLIILDFPDYKTSASKEARAAAEAEGRTPVLSATYAELSDNAEKIVANLKEAGFDLRTPGALVQHRVEWADPASGVLCSGVLDWVDLKKGLILDFKTTSDASDSALQRDVFKYGYDIQHRSYTEALETLHPELQGRLKMFFLFAETDQPFAVNPLALAGSMAELGRRRWQRAKETWKECMATGVWPGYARADKRIEATAWQMSAETDFDLVATDFDMVSQLGGMR